MDDLLPLLRILPSFQRVGGEYMIRGAVNERDWSRFRRYANRIRELVHRPGDYLDSNHQFSAFVYFSIGRLCGMEPLLPSLRKLHCFSTTEMLLFSTSALSHVKVEIRVSDEDQIVEQFLRMLIDRDPAIVDLTVIGRLSTGSLNALCRFTSLRSLILRDTVSITIPVLQAIAAFPHLSNMEIDLRDMKPVNPSVWNPAAFPKLEDLTVYGTLGWCDEVLGALSTPTLKSVCISVVEPSYHMKSQTFVRGWMSYFQRLRSVSRWTLRRVQVGYVESVSLSDSPVHVTILGRMKKVRTRIIMQSLLRISGLESVKFTSWPSLPLSDRDVRDIALAWPKLVELCLPDAAVEQPSIGSIAYLIASCPLLTSMDATLYLHHLEFPDFPPICTRALCAWAANDPHPGRLVCLARHLNRVLAFPRSDPTYQPITIKNLFHICRSLSPDETSQLFQSSSPLRSPVTLSGSADLLSHKRSVCNDPSPRSAAVAVPHGLSSAQPMKESKSPMVQSSNQEGLGGSGPGSGRSKRGEKTESNRVGTGQAGHGSGFGGIESSGGAGGPHDPEPLVHSGNRWVPHSVSRKPVAVDPDSPEAVDRKVRSLLNKLTMEKFDSISSQIVEWVNKSEKEKNGRTLTQVIRLVFEKAIDEALWSEMYARQPPIQLQQPGTPIQTHPVPSSVHPIPPPLGPSSSVNSMSSPPTTPSTMGSTLSQPAARLSTNEPAFVPRKVTIKSAVDGQELNIETLKHTHTQSGTPAAPAATATTSRRVSVRIESEDVKKKRLDQEQAEEKARREKDERAKKEKEDAERKKREAEEAERERLRKEEEEKERLRKEDEERERKRKEEEEKERLRKEAEERERLEEEERKRKEAEEEEKAEKERLRREVEKAEAEREQLRKEDEERAVASAAAAQAEGESTPTVPEEAEEGEIVDTPPLQLRIDTTVPIKSPTLDGLKKRPDPLDLSHSHRPIPAPLPSALATAKVIDDLGRVPYPEGILSPKVELNVNAKDGKFRYDRDFLLQFMSICKEKPDMLPPLDAIGLEPVDQTYSMARGGSGRHRQSSNPPPSSSSRPAVGLGISGSSSGAFGKPAPFNMAMGNFSTMPTKLSSDERFAMSNGARVASGPAGMQFGRAPPMVRSFGEGGPGGSGPGSGRHKTRTKREQKRDESTGLPGNELECGGIGSPGGVGGLHEPKPLVHSWNRWVPTSIWKKGVAVDPNSPEVVDRKVRALLNKLTMEKFDSLSSQIVEWANKSEKEKNGRTLVQVIRLVFENATDQAMWSELYARLCREMMEQISPNVQDDGIKNAEGKPIASGQLFRKYLLNRCQEDFERGWVAKEVTAVAAVTNAIEDQAAAKDTIDKGEEVVLYSDKYYAAQKAKRQGLGLIKFIGELFKLQMLTERIMHECIKKLLGNVDDPEEEEIESLCVLLATVGAILDTNKARAHMDVYFSRMNQTVKSPNVRARLRFMLQDVIELRERKWVPRKIVAAPSTIAQVHEAAAKEKAAQEKEAHQRQMAMSHRGSRRDGECSRKTTQPGDLSHFGKAVKSTPTSFIPSGVFTDKKHSTKKEPSSSSPTSLNSSMFSMLSQNADGTVVEAGASEHAYSGRKGSVDITQSLSEPPKRKKVVLQPRPKPVKKPTAVPPPPPSDGNLDGKPPTLPPPPSMSEARARKKIAEDMKEFFGVRNLDEAEEYFTSLPIKHRFRLVDKLVATAIDSKETDAQLVADFFAQAIEKELCGPTIFEDGFTPTAEILDDLKYDTPKAFELMAIMMKGAGLDKDEERSKRIASKSTNSHKLLALLSS